MERKPSGGYSHPESIKDLKTFAEETLGESYVPWRKEREASRAVVS